MQTITDLINEGKNDWMYIEYTESLNEGKHKNVSGAKLTSISFWKDIFNEWDDDASDPKQMAKLVKEKMSNNSSIVFDFINTIVVLVKNDSIISVPSK